MKGRACDSHEGCQRLRPEGARDALQQSHSCQCLGEGSAQQVANLCSARGPLRRMAHLYLHPWLSQFSSLHFCCIPCNAVETLWHNQTGSLSRHSP